MRWRSGDPTAEPFAFAPERTFRVPLQRGQGVTYSNLATSCRGGGPCIPEAIVNIFRAEDWNPIALASYGTCRSHTDCDLAACGRVVELTP